MANPKKGARTKSKRKSVDAEGMAHIKATFNNTLITITDLQGNVVAWGRAGKAAFQGPEESPPFAAAGAAEQGGGEAVERGVKGVHERLEGPGGGREFAIQAQEAAGLQV